MPRRAGLIKLVSKQQELLASQPRLPLSWQEPQQPSAAIAVMPGPAAPSALGSGLPTAQLPCCRAATRSPPRDDAHGHLAALAEHVTATRCPSKGHVGEIGARMQCGAVNSSPGCVFWGRGLLGCCPLIKALRFYEMRKLLCNSLCPAAAPCQCCTKCPLRTQPGRGLKQQRGYREELVQKSHELRRRSPRCVPSPLCYSPRNPSVLQDTAQKLPERHSSGGERSARGAPRDKRHVSAASKQRKVGAEGNQLPRCLTGGLPELVCFSFPKRWLGIQQGW